MGNCVKSSEIVKNLSLQRISSMVFHRMQTNEYINTAESTEMTALPQIPAMRSISPAIKSESAYRALTAIVHTKTSRAVSDPAHTVSPADKPESIYRNVRTRPKVSDPVRTLIGFREP